MDQRNVTRILLMTVVLVLTGCGREEKAAAANTVAKEATEEIGFGSVTDSVYRNAYFGLEVPLPAGWTVLSRGVLDKAIETGGKLVLGEDEDLEAAVEAAKLTTVSLFVAYKHPQGTAVRYNPSIACVAERVSDSPGIVGGRDFLRQMKELLEASPMEVSFSEAASTKRLGGTESDVMHAEISLPTVKVQQTSYAAIIKGYSLVFSVSHAEGEEEPLLQDTLGKVSFR